MRSVFIRYQAKPDRADENRALIADVFAELGQAQPEKLRYLVLDFEDGTFVHYAVTPTDLEADPLRQIGAFQRFQTDSGERQLVKATVMTPRVVGNYRMLLGEPDAFKGV
jgi:hypothetical protein